jgi:hypothetical protein
MTGPSGIDPRGPRFTATVTLVVLAAVLVVPSHTVSAVLIGLQAALFATGTLLGVQRTPTGLFFKHVVRPRLSPPAELEDPRPPRFAQGVGLVFATVSLIGYVSGAILLGQVFAGFALVAAFLNSAFGFCLGCEMYLLGLRLTRRAA